MRKIVFWVIGITVVVSAAIALAATATHLIYRSGDRIERPESQSKTEQATSTATAEMTPPAPPNKFKPLLIYKEGGSPVISAQAKAVCFPDASAYKAVADRETSFTVSPDRQKAFQYQVAETVRIKMRPSPIMPPESLTTGDWASTFVFIDDSVEWAKWSPDSKWLGFGGKGRQYMAYFREGVIVDLTSFCSEQTDSPQGARPTG